MGISNDVNTNIQIVSSHVLHCAGIYTKTPCFLEYVVDYFGQSLNILPITGELDILLPNFIIFIGYCAITMMIVSSSMTHPALC